MSDSTIPWALRSARKPNSTSGLNSKYSFPNINIFKRCNSNETMGESSRHGKSNEKPTSLSSNEHALVTRTSCFEPAKLIKQGPRKVQKAVVGFASSLDQLSQRLRRSTRRRYRLTDSPFTPDSPGYRSRTATAGHRTPVDSPDGQLLYSPFGIDSPSRRTPRRRCSQIRRAAVSSGCDNQAMDFSPSDVGLRRRVLNNVSNQLEGGSVKRSGRGKTAGSPSSAEDAVMSDVFYSPTRRLRVDVCQAERSGRELVSAAQRISAASLRI